MQAPAPLDCDLKTDAQTDRQSYNMTLGAAILAQNTRHRHS